MSEVVSLQSCVGGVEAVLHDVKKQTCQNETMTIFCKTKQINSRDIDQYPLLEYQWQEIDNIETNRPKYDASYWLENFRCGDGRTREILRRFREKCVSSSRREISSSHSASKEVASTWIKMSKHHETEVRPLRNSTRCNVIAIGGRKNDGAHHYPRALHDNNPGTNSQTSFQSTTLLENRRIHTAGTVSSTGTSSSTKNTGTSTRSKTKHKEPNGQNSNSKQPQQQSSVFTRRRESIIPPPPPYISYHRRFRVCYGVMSEWRAAVDQKSGRTYYFNIRTRATQWKKPVELASDTEREEIERKERTQKLFFSAMEANILKSMATGKVVEESPKPKETNTRPEVSGSLEKPQMVRTISAMDENILTKLVKNVSTTEAVYRRASQRANTMAKIAEGSMSSECEISLSGSMTEFFMKSSDDGFGMSDEDIDALRDLSEIAKEMRSSIGSNFDSPKTGLLDEDEEEDPRLGLKQRARPISEDSLSALIEEEEKESENEEDLRSGLKEKPNLIKKSKSKPKLMKRNTCGTIYLQTTMSAPDKDATIKCVCGVFRTHIISAMQDSKVYDAQRDPYRIFNDRDSQRRSVAGGDLTLAELRLDSNIPSLDEISNFYRDIFFRAQMESDCIIMSLIYVERLIKVTGGDLRPRLSNWRSLFFACLILSSKVWDDLSMWNADFSQTCPAGVSFSLQRINELELAVLNALKFTVKVPASEYAKYYFLLRSMLIKSGLGGDDMRKMNPLDVAAAHKLEQVSTSYQAVADTKKRVSQEKNLRSKSMGDVEKEKLLSNRGTGTKLNLEHIVQM